MKKNMTVLNSLFLHVYIGGTDAALEWNVSDVKVSQIYRPRHSVLHFFFEATNVFNAYR